MARPPRIPVWLGWEQEVIYFATFCVAGRKRVLANDAVFAALRAAQEKVRGWTILAGVLMPDHVHLLVAPEERDAALGNFVGAMKRWIRQEVRAQWRWQPGTFDRLLRRDESVSQKWEYIRQNPVRAGLVTDWRLWPYRIGFCG